MHASRITANLETAVHNFYKALKFACDPTSWARIWEFEVRRANACPFQLDWLSFIGVNRGHWFFAFGPAQNHCL